MRGCSTGRRFAPRGGQNEQNETPGFAKRNERFREAGHKPLKSLGREMSDFVISFVFKALSPLSFRAFLAPALRGPGGRDGGAQSASFTIRHHEHHF